MQVTQRIIECGDRLGNESEMDAYHGLCDAWISPVDYY